MIRRAFLRGGTRYFDLDNPTIVRQFEPHPPKRTRLGCTLKNRQALAHEPEYTSKPTYDRLLVITLALGILS